MQWARTFLRDLPEQGGSERLCLPRLRLSDQDGCDRL